MLILLITETISYSYSSVNQILYATERSRLESITESGVSMPVSLSLPIPCSLTTRREETRKGRLRKINDALRPSFVAILTCPTLGRADLIVATRFALRTSFIFSSPLFCFSDKNQSHLEY